MRPSKPFLISLAAIAVAVLAVKIVSFINTPGHSAADSAYNSLRQIDAAKNQWALEKGKASGDIPSWNNLLPYLGSSFTNCYQTNGVFVSPNGVMFFIGRIGQPPVCSDRGEIKYLP